MEDRKTSCCDDERPDRRRARIQEGTRSAEVRPPVACNGTDPNSLVVDLATVAVSTLDRGKQKFCLTLAHGVVLCDSMAFRLEAL